MATDQLIHHFTEDILSWLTGFYRVKRTMTRGVAIGLDYLGLRVNILYQIKIYSGNKTRGPMYTAVWIVRIHPVAFKEIVSVGYKSDVRVRMQLWNNTLPERLRLQKSLVSEMWDASMWSRVQTTRTWRIFVNDECLHSNLPSSLLHFQCSLV